MKKNKYYLLIFSLLFAVNFTFAQFNDCKEYGFKGKVKKVTTYNYVDLEKINGSWILDEKKLISIWEFIVDKNQNFREVKTTYFNKDSTEIYTYKYEFDNHLKKSYLKTDQNGNIVETAKYYWLNDKTYSTTFEFGDYIIETKSILNNLYRDYVGETTVYEVYENKKLPIEKTSYKNFFDNNGIIQKTEKYDVMGKITSTIINKVQDFDEKGNMVEFAIIEDNGTLERFVKRVFEYVE